MAHAPEATMGLLKDDLAGPGVELVETHTAWVFLGEGAVWKVKKPVNLGFLDFASQEKRHAACEAEVRLNSRLAPGVYDRVVPITRDATGLHRIEGDGTVVDWAVKMVRLSDAQRADTLLENRALTERTVEELAEYIASFHATVPSSEAISAFGKPEMILSNVGENFEQTHESVRRYLSERDASEIEMKQIGFVVERRDLFEARVRNGRIRDGHGDLRLEHVYLTDGRPPTIIDCIEFNERFRYADVCADLAFLSMDFERLGRADLAETLLAAYARASGDYELFLLVDFYESYRAYVRAKVASILAADSQADMTIRARAAQEARRCYLLSLSEGRTSLLRPSVIAIGGIIASGKSTIAKSVARMASAPIVDADRTRKSMLGVDPTTRIHDAAWTGAYAPEFTERVYATLMGRARCVLSSGRPVVLDASFRTRAMRDEARRLAEAYRVPFYFVECRADAEESKKRLARRACEGGVSDGRPEIFDQFVQSWEPVSELPSGEHIVLDTTRPQAESSARIARHIPTWPPGLTR
jgi:aminoglycoside phosphotransferase family enzyme/predicted kinase